MENVRGQPNQGNSGELRRLTMAIYPDESESERPFEQSVSSRLGSTEAVLASRTRFPAVDRRPGETQSGSRKNLVRRDKRKESTVRHYKRDQGCDDRADHHETIVLVAENGQNRSVREKVENLQAKEDDAKRSEHKQPGNIFGRVHGSRERDPAIHSKKALWGRDRIESQRRLGAKSDLPVQPRHGGRRTRQT